MLSNTLDKISFGALFLVVVLLPIFFIPFTKIPVETSKGLLLVVGLIVSIIFWLAARLSERKIFFPKSVLLISGFGIALVFFLSTIFSAVPQVSFFGTLFDIGSFWFIFACFLLMFTCSVVLQDSRKAQMVLWWSIVSFVIIILFQALRFFIPTALSFGVLVTKTDNIFGAWNALGIFAGFMSIISLFIIEFFSVSKLMKWMLAILIILALIFVAAVNFSLIWILIGVFSLLIFIYKISFHSGLQSNTSGDAKFPSFSLAVIMVSLLFFVSGQFIWGYLPNKLKVINTEVTPSFGATLSVTKSVLIKHPILGAGPNKFGEVWALYKPGDINYSQFWNIYFDSGYGLLPTFASTTGLLGILAWLIFFFLLIKAGLKSIFSGVENNINFELAIFFLAALYLFVSALFYATGAVLFLLAFAFTGIFIGLLSNRQGGMVSISFLNNPRKSFFSIFFIVLLMVTSAGFGFKYIEHFASVPYFARALSATDVPTAETSIHKALALNQNDLYLRTYAEIYLIQFNSLVHKGSSATDAEKADLKNSFNEAVNGAQLATSYDKLNYLNFQTLGYVYGTAGVLGVTGAYDKAVGAYTTASSLNPLNPDLKLSIARVFLAEGQTTQAKDYATQALNLKPDYVEGLVVLSQISKSEGDNNAAIFYAERALSFAPDNKDLASYLDSLQKPSSLTSTPKIPPKKGQ